MDCDSAAGNAAKIKTAMHPDSYCLRQGIRGLRTFN